MTNDSGIPQPLENALRNTRHVFVLTGAGVSAESGIPTFREAQTGLWASYDPLELATPDAFQRNPELVWKWYAWRRELVARAEPNDGHRALARLADLVPKLTLVTQNVDGLHQRAGSSGVIEMHGNLFETRCAADQLAIENVQNSAEVPTCPACGANGRPGVVWFGEAIPSDALEMADRGLSDCDLFFSVGTSAQVWPAAGFVDVAKRNDATTVEVNPTPTNTGGTFDVQLQEPAGVGLPKLVNWLATVRET